MNKIYFFVIILFLFDLNNLICQDYSTTDNIYFEITIQSDTHVYVDDDNTSGPWDGSEQDPYQYISDGISNATSGQNVVVMPGDYQISQDLIVPNDIILFLHAGVLTSFSDGYGLEVSGKLQAMGTVNDSIKFTSTLPESNWKGIKFSNNDVKSELRYCIIENSIGFDGDKGGGIYISNSSPKLYGCHIRNNTANYGAGVFCDSFSSPEIINCEIVDNIANISGGGIFSNFSTPLIKENFIMYNESLSGIGGGLAIYDIPFREIEKKNKGIKFSRRLKQNRKNIKVDKNKDLRRKKIKKEIPGGLISQELQNLSKIDIKTPNKKGQRSLNTSSNILYYRELDRLYEPEFGIVAVIKSNTIQENSSSSFGGGLAIYESRTIIYDNSFIENSSESGGGIYLSEADSSSVEWNMIKSNEVSSHGGGIYSTSSDVLVFSRNLILNNSSNSGGGIYLNECTSKFYNNTLFEDTGSISGSGLYSNNGSNSLYNNIFWNNTSPDNEQIVGNGIIAHYNNIEGDFIGVGNISEDPLFVNSLLDNFHLDYNSPSINSGNPTSDEDPDDTIADTGVYYYHNPGPIIKVFPELFSIGVEADGSFTTDFKILNRAGNNLLYSFECLSNDEPEVAIKSKDVTRPIWDFWLSLNDEYEGEGTIGAYESKVFTARFDAFGYSEGTYNGEIIITSNDPINSQIIISLAMIVGITTPPDIEVFAENINFDTIFVDGTISETLEIFNFGTSILHINDILIDNPDFDTVTTSLDIQGGDSQELIMDFTPSSLGVITANMDIYSDDPNDPVFTLELIGEGVNPSNVEISVLPVTFVENLETGDTLNRDLTISNDGEDDLTFSYSINYNIGSKSGLPLNDHTQYNLGNSIQEASSGFSFSEINRRNNKRDKKLIKPIIVPLSKIIPESSSRSCEYTVDLYDDYGDGWTDCSLDLLINDTVVLDDLTLDDGNGPVSFPFEVDSGDQISTEFTAGSWPSECSYYIYDENGVQVASDGAGGNEPSGIDPFTVSWATWLAIDGEIIGEGSTPPNESSVLNLEFDTSELEEDTYYAEINILSNDPNNSQIIVPVTMIVSYETTPANDQIWISEVCDDDQGILPSQSGTGFIELFNSTGVPASLDGYWIERGNYTGTQPTGSFTGDGTIYNIPAGYTIPVSSFFTIGNGADVDTFNSAWGTSLDETNYDSGDFSLDITNGYAYQLDNGSKAIIDNTPNVPPTDRITQEPDQTWNPPETSDNGTPAGFGGDTPLDITLASFTAQFNNDELTLYWATYSEIDNTGWNIYRAELNLFSSSVKINSDLIEGNGTTSFISEYEFIDDTSFEFDKTYWYWIQSIDYSGATDLFGPISINTDESPDNPTAPTTLNYGLQQNYPNPFNPITTINFTVKEDTPAELVIYNLKGQKVITLFKGTAIHDQQVSIDWNSTDTKGNDVTTGIYIYKLITKDNSEIKRMLLMK